MPNTIFTYEQQNYITENYYSKGPAKIAKELKTEKFRVHNFAQTHGLQKKMKAKVESLSNYFSVDELLNWVA
ncbi:MAG: hypothetical protein ABI091_26625 [Ferruginibacter sp.]